MNTNKLSQISSLYLMAAMMSDPFSHNDVGQRLRKKSHDEIVKDRLQTIKQREQKVIVLKIERGMKVFKFGDVTILALNKKNAERKYFKQIREQNESRL